MYDFNRRYVESSYDAAWTISVKRRGHMLDIWMVDRLYVCVYGDSYAFFVWTVFRIQGGRMETGVHRYVTSCAPLIAPLW